MHRRNHYAALDGLRGLAAVSVLLFHLGHWQQRPKLAGNAGQAVDFFFMLSGYILSVAYRSRLDSGMRISTLIRIRLIRLMPIIMLGTLISAAYLAARIYVLHDPEIGTDELLLATLLGLLCLPMFTASNALGGPAVFPLNAPQYTLFLELIVNCFWIITRRIEGLGLALAIAAGCYAMTAIYGMTGDQIRGFWTGFPRVFGAYYGGIVVYYAQNRWAGLTERRAELCFWPLLAMTFLLFYWPTSVSHWTSWGWTLFFSPLLIYTGSRIRLNGVVQRAALILGELSYPVYALHYPIFVWVNAAYQQALHRKDFAIGSALAVPSVLIGAWAFLKWFDEPIRRRLMAGGS